MATLIFRRKTYSFDDSFYSLCPEVINGNGFRLEKRTGGFAEFMRHYLFLGRNSVQYDLYLGNKKVDDSIGLDKDKDIPGHGRVLTVIDLDINNIPPQAAKGILQNFEAIAKQFGLRKIWIVREDGEVPVGAAEKVLRQNGYTLDNYFEKDLHMNFPIYTKTL